MFTSSLRFSYKSSFLEEEHDSPAYQLGAVADVENPDSIYASQYIYLQCGVTSAAYNFYTVAAGWKAEAISVTADNQVIVCPQRAFTNNKYGFYLVKGEGKGNVENTTGVILPAGTPISAKVGDLFAKSDHLSAFEASTISNTLESQPATTTSIISVLLLATTVAPEAA
tara:strand:- start:10495 stop:11001 length:507 start_codon:yes stop_codon:yes gene_type:complete